MRGSVFVFVGSNEDSSHRKRSASGEAEMSKRPDAKVGAHKEDDQLRAAAALGEAVAISKRLCRSEKAVRHRAHALGIKLPSLRRFGFPYRPIEFGPKASVK
jgi:hypothetical protein